MNADLQTVISKNGLRMALSPFYQKLRAFTCFPDNRNIYILYADFM